MDLHDEIFTEEDTSPAQAPAARGKTKPSRLRKPNIRFGSNRSNKSRKGPDMSAGPVRPFANSKPPRQTPKVVKHSYRVAGGWLRAIQPVNALIVAAVLTVVLTMLHGWGHLSLHGVGVGLLFSAVELALFSWVLHLLDASTRKPAMVYAAVFAVVIMLAVAGAVVLKLSADVFSVLVAFAYVVAVADPVGFVNAKMSLQAEREEFDAEKQVFYLERDQQNAIIGERLRQATETLSNAHVTEERLTLKEARIDNDVEERVQEGVTRYASQLKTAVEQTLGVVKAQEAAEAAAAEYTAARQQYTLTHEQLLEQARQEVAAEVEALRQQITRDRFIPPPMPTSEFSEGEPADHQVVSSEVIG